MGRPRPHQTKLDDFDEEGNLSVPVDAPFDEPTGKLWRKITRDDGWGVCEFDETVFFAQIIDGEIHAYGNKAVCKWCGGKLEIREDKVFCTSCGTYQGRFSHDLNSYLRWDGAKSYTLRREIARIEGLQLEERDLRAITTSEWSMFDMVDYEEL